MNTKSKLSDVSSLKIRTSALEKVVNKQAAQIAKLQANEIALRAEAAAWHKRANELLEILDAPEEVLTSVLHSIRRRIAHLKK